jgi:hypothetical protein
LANALRAKLHLLIGSEPRLAERLEVHALNSIARRLYELNLGRLQIASPELVRQLLAEAARQVEGQKFSPHFLATEWEEVVDAWQLDTWEAYRDVARLGRKTRLPEKQREALWAVFLHARAGLETRGLVTQAQLFNRVASHLATVKQSPFDFTVDEAQDVSVAQLRFLAALGGGRPNGLFFAGTWVSGSFSSPFPGRRSALRSVGAPGRYGSTTAPPIKSGRRPTGCSGQPSPMSTVMSKSDAARSRCSTVRSQLSASSRPAKPRSRRSAAGWRIHFGG